MGWAVGEWERKAVEVALESQDAAVELAVAGWRLRFEEEGAANSALSARLGDGWLMLDAHVDGLASDGPGRWSLLQRSGQLAGGAKIVAVEDAPGGMALRLRGELPLDPRLDLAASLRRLVAGFRGELSALGEIDSALQPLEGASLVLASRCEEAGWLFTPRSDGGGAVDLEVGEGFMQARVTRGSDGGIVLRVEPGECVAAGDACSSAQALFLLRASAWLRLVRGAGERGEAGWQPRFEVVLGPEPGSEELDQAFSALSVACFFCAEELRALGGSPEAARVYLALAGERQGSRKRERRVARAAAPVMERPALGARQART
jgi:hypothetical protein